MSDLYWMQVVAGDRLSELEQLRQSAKATDFDSPTSISKNALCEKLFSLEPKGKLFLQS